MSKMFAEPAGPARNGILYRQLLDGDRRDDLFPFGSDDPDARIGSASSSPASFAILTPRYTAARARVLAPVCLFGWLSRIHILDLFYEVHCLLRE